MTLNYIGLSFMNMHKQADALNYLQQSLKIFKKASLNISSDVNMAMTLNKTGMCFLFQSIFACVL